MIDLIVFITLLNYTPDDCTDLINKCYKEKKYCEEFRKCQKETGCILLISTEKETACVKI